jgi:hypothetical protein
MLAKIAVATALTIATAGAALASNEHDGGNDCIITLRSPASASPRAARMPPHDWA